MAHWSCPWHQRFSLAAFAPQGLVRLLDPRLEYLSRSLRQLYRMRAGFAVQYPDHFFDRAHPSEKLQLAGAVLSKITHRGVPTMGSLEVERHALTVARDAGVLAFQETDNTGAFEFDVSPVQGDLELQLKASLIPPLLVSDESLEDLLDRYRSLCTDLEAEVFEGLVQRFEEKRLALLVLPQREFRTMLLAEPVVGGDESQRVDFALQVPDLGKADWLCAAIEVDDPTHDAKAQRALDKQRDESLVANGWKAVRMPIAKRAAWDNLLDRVVLRMEEAITSDLLSAAKQLRETEEDRKRAILGITVLPIAEAQLASVAAELIYNGIEGAIRVACPDDIDISAAIDGVNQVIKAISDVHALGDLPHLEHVETGADLIYHAWPTPDAWFDAPAQAVTVSPQVVSHDYVPELLPASPAVVLPEVEKDANRLNEGLEYVLQNVFRKVAYREGQLEIIRRTLSLRSTIGLLPTAAGKSLCYQVPSMLEPGFALIIDPLRSLMIDQQDSLQAMGIERSIAVMSGMSTGSSTDRETRDRACRAIAQGQQWFVFVAPERLQMPDFRQNVRAFAATVPVSFCVIDEAHCVSEWGHDFRPAYLNVGRLVRDYCRHDEYQPAIVALTGTASRNVIIDIMRELEITDQEAVVEPKTFNRSELSFSVHRVESRDRMAEVVGRIKQILMSFGWRPNQPGSVPSGLIFTYFVNDRELGVAQIASELTQRLGIPVEVFAGSMPKGFAGDRKEWDRRKLEIQNRFSRNESPILVCTHGFGMGIDKANIRFTIHVMLPLSLEDFYQQCGRAGRDQADAQCEIIFCDDQPHLTNEILDTTSTPFEQIQTKANGINRYRRGDALRNTWFLTNSFLGSELEKRILNYVVHVFLMPHLPQHKGDRNTVDINFHALPVDLFEGGGASGRVSGKDREASLEKALYRLMIVGALPDYMKDYTGKRFQVMLDRRDPEEIAAALARQLRLYVTEGEARSFFTKQAWADFEEAASQAGAVWVDFIYETVAKRRRRAIGEMLETARRADKEGPDQFRRDLLAYLEESEFTEPVTKLATRIVPHDWIRLLIQVQGADGIVKLAGACRRALTESPSHPGLLILRGLCRFASTDPRMEARELRNGFIEFQKLEEDPDQRVSLAQEVLGQAERLMPSRVDDVLCEILAGDPSLEMGRTFYERANAFGPGHHLALRTLLTHLTVHLAVGD